MDQTSRRAGKLRFKLDQATAQAHTGNRWWRRNEIQVSRATVRHFLKKRSYQNHQENAYRHRGHPRDLRQTPTKSRVRETTEVKRRGNSFPPLWMLQEPSHNHPLNPSSPSQTNQMHRSLKAKGTNSENPGAARYLPTLQPQSRQLLLPRIIWMLIWPSRAVTTQSP